MYLGRIVESAPREALFRRPAHPYARLLLDAAPSLDANALRRTQASASNELPSPYDPPSGCRFRTRCPHAVERCAAETPELRELGAGHHVACHRAGDI